MAGRLRHRVIIQAQATTQDSVGQRTISWTDVENAWARISPVAGKDYFNQSGEHAEITHKILMRHGATIAVGNRLALGTRTFDVRAVLNLGERNSFLQIMAVENAG